ncbi:MAG: ABC transporter ATP-binding protein [Granulosicoccus sp.]
MSLIRCDALTKRYGGTVALDSVSLELGTGEPVALIGPNGAGKTTFLSLVCGFIQPSGGQVRILGHAPGSRELSGKLAALPQDALLDPRLSVGRQLRFFARLQGMGKQEANAESLRVLEMVDLRDSINTRPTDLSHGMRKRVAIAQSLMGSPSLVLLDEPTAGIDPPNAKMIRDLVRDQSAHTTFIVSSHNLDELERLCGSVIYLEKGRLVSFGAVADDADHDVLTLRAPSVPADVFIPLCEQLPHVVGIEKTAQGDFLIETDSEMQASIALLQLLSDNGWRYRQLSRGKTLEERLYGNA